MRYRNWKCRFHRRFVETREHFSSICGLQLWCYEVPKMKCINKTLINLEPLTWKIQHRYWNLQTHINILVKSRSLERNQTKIKDLIFVNRIVKGHLIKHYIFETIFVYPLDSLCSHVFSVMVIGMYMLYVFIDTIPQKRWYSKAPQWRTHEI